MSCAGPVHRSAGSFSSARSTQSVYAGMRRRSKFSQSIFRIKIPRSHRQPQLHLAASALKRPQSLFDNLSLLHKEPFVLRLQKAAFSALSDCTPMENLQKRLNFMMRFAHQKFPSSEFSKQLEERFSRVNKRGLSCWVRSYRAPIRNYFNLR